MILAIVVIGVYAVIVAAFIWSTERDTRSWTTYYEQFAHPYSKLSQGLCLAFLVGIIPFAAAVDYLLP